MALVIASLAWLVPARVIRSQVLTMRERSYVQIARLSGVSGPEIIFKELLPNLLPYLVASLVDGGLGAILASIGLEVLGLGSLDSPTLGMTLYWVNYNAALINGWWWWWVPPIVVIVVLFMGLFLVTDRPGRVRQPTAAQADLGNRYRDAARVRGLKPTSTLLQSLRDARVNLTGITPIVAQRRPMVDVDFSPRTPANCPSGGAR